MTVRDKNGRFAKKEEAPKFKVGDRVYSKPSAIWRPNSFGVIVLDDGKYDLGMPYRVRFDSDGTKLWVNTKDIELAADKQPITTQPEAEAAFVALAKALGYSVKKVK